MVDSLTEPYKDDYSLIIVEHKDRLSRVIFNYLKVLLNKQEKDKEVVNLATERTDDLKHDFVSIITSFCARLYLISIKSVNQQFNKRKVELQSHLKGNRKIKALAYY